MHTVRNRERDSLPSKAASAAAPAVIVDCIDCTAQDLLTLWLTQAGYPLGATGTQGPRGHGVREPDAAVLITDRFGPGRDGGVTIPELRARKPNLRIVVVGCGDWSQSAQLSLARVVGAHATLPAPLKREQVLDLMECWSS